MGREQQPVEMIQARSLLASLSTAAFLVDGDGTLLFYNESAGRLLGLRFEEAGPMAPEEWGTRFKPRDAGGREVPVEELPLTVALRAGRPGHARLQITAADEDEHEILVTALPIMGGGRQRGALAIFWPVDSA